MRIKNEATNFPTIHRIKSAVATRLTDGQMPPATKPTAIRTYIPTMHAITRTDIEMALNEIEIVSLPTCTACMLHMYIYTLYTLTNG